MRHTIRRSLGPAVAMSALWVLPAAAQGDQRPAGWDVVFDDPAAADSSLFFVSMEPGWHITSGPAALLYDPARSAAGEFRVEAEIFLFPGTSDEGFGLMFGGADLGSAVKQSYFEFLLRRDGGFLVAHRAGSELHVLTPWAVHEAALAATGSDEPVLNTLMVIAGADVVSFVINGEEVARFPRSSGMDLDGPVGLRVGDDLNLHVRSLTVATEGAGD